MNKFVQNLTILENTLNSYKLNKDTKNFNDITKHLNDINLLIEINDDILSFTQQSPKHVKNFVKLKQEFKELQQPIIQKHMSSLIRKQKLMDINDDVDYLVSLNKYMKVVIEEKSTPINNLLSSIKTSEYEIQEGNNQLEIFKSRRRKWHNISKIVKVILVLCSVYIFTIFFRVLRSFIS